MLLALDMVGGLKEWSGGVYESKAGTALLQSGRGATHNDMVALGVSEDGRQRQHGRVFACRLR